MPRSLSLVLVVAIAARAAGAQHASDSSLVQSADSIGRSASRAYSTITIRGGALANVNEERLHEYWKPGSGMFIEIETPAPVGALSIGATFLPFNGLATEQPDFRSQLFELRWSLRRTIATRLSLRGSAAVGSFHMQFDDGARAVSGLTREAELVAGAAGSADVQLASWLGVVAELGYHRIFTRYPIGLVTARAGARATAATPRWLQRVLE